MKLKNSPVVFFISDVSCSRSSSNPLGWGAPLTLTFFGKGEASPPLLEAAVVAEGRFWYAGIMSY